MAPQLFVLLSAVFSVLFKLFDDNVLGGPHLCGSDSKSLIKRYMVAHIKGFHLRKYSFL